MTLYWLEWVRKDGKCARGFPWTYRKQGPVVGTDMAIIAADSEGDAWEKAEWTSGVRERYQIVEIESIDDVPVDFEEPSDWWPDPETAWLEENMNREEGWDPSFWSDEYERLPRIYGFINGTSLAGVSGIAIAEDGKVLAQHLSSSRAWAKHDIFSSNKKPLFDAHYPDGYNAIWLDSGDPRIDKVVEAAEQQ